VDFVVDTSFLIQRWRLGAASPEQRFIDTHVEATVGIPWIVKGEFLRGAELAGHESAAVAAFLGRYPVLWPDEQTLLLYAKTYAVLARSNGLIGPHDLWIASAVLQVDLPLLTRNVAEFRRVPGLRVEAYT
jgi:tRNA(fMet)-specific endonuclease VapC